MNGNAVLLAVLSVPLLYVVARIVFAAYFKAKEDYQKRLISVLAKEDYQS